MTAELRFHLVPAADIAVAFELECAGYPADEAATYDKLVYRQKHAPELFLGAYIPLDTNDRGKLIGFVVGTQCRGTLSHESMSDHDNQGETICIHSVCVDAGYRRQRVASRLLDAYYERATELVKDGQCKTERIQLLAHTELSELYEKCGYRSLGVSDVVHGGKPWLLFERKVPE
jgi:ribosomal protein S18 acetylase RimI-like enzyme